MSAKIYYTKRHVSGFNFGFTRKVTSKFYDQNGEFIKRVDEEPNLDEHYSLVDEIDFPLGSVRKQPVDVDEEVPATHLSAIFRFYNQVKPSEITDRILNDGLNTAHSSMSIGDLVEIDGHFFVVENYGFSRLKMK